MAIYNRLGQSKFIYPISTICMLTVSQLSSAQSRPVIEEVIVTAQKRAQNVQDIPVAVTAIDAQSIEQLGIQSSADVVRIVPSLTVTEGNNKTNSAFSIRGIGTNTFGIGIEQAVVMIVDDVALVQQGQSLANLIDIERIEVLRGPQSTLFGKAASAGVISITTKRPSEQFEGTAEVTATDEQAYRVVGSVSGPLSDNIGYRVTGFWHDTDGYVKNIAKGYDDFNGEKGEGFRSKLQWDVGDNTEITMGAYYTDEKSDCCARVFRELNPEDARFQNLIDISSGISPSEDNTTVRYDTLPDSDNDTKGINLRIAHNIGEYTFLSITAYDEWKYTNKEDVDFSDEIPDFIVDQLGVSQFFSDSDRKSDYLSQEFRLVSPVYDKFDYLIGFFYAKSDIDRDFYRNLPVAPVDEYSHAESENLAVFGQLNWNFTSMTSASIGLRYLDEQIEAKYINFLEPTTVTAHANDGDGDVVGKVSLQHFVREGVMLYTSYTRGYKGQAYDIANFDNVGGLDPVKPEISDAYELGLKSMLWDQRMQLNITAFYAEYDDFQVQGADTTSQVIEFQLNNAGKLETKGVELETTTLLTDQLALTFNASYVDAEINDFDGANCYVGQTPESGCIDGTQTIDGGELPNSPKWKYTALLDYEYPLNSLPFDGFANVIYTWQDDVRFGIDQDPLTTQKSYGVTNLRIGIKDNSERYEISAFVNNLFAEHYVGDQLNLSSFFPPGTTAIIQTVPRNAQRYWGMKAKLNF